MRALRVAGTKKLSDVLTQLGANIPPGLTLTAESIFADGTTVASQYVDSQFNLGNWMAHISK